VGGAEDRPSSRGAIVGGAEDRPSSKGAIVGGAATEGRPYRSLERLRLADLLLTKGSCFNS
jgi:hypothetical protein